MQYEIKNAIPLLTSDNFIAGAALKILVLGGNDLSDEKQQQASGCTPWHWRDKKPDIMRLVAALEA